LRRIVGKIKIIIDCIRVEKEEERMGDRWADED
jgi:hypothetical protein